MPGWRILVVDDEPYVAMAIREVLETLPAAVSEAHGGEEALAKVRAERPSLILLDIRMPDMDGFQVAEALKRDPGTAEIPIVFLSALSSPKEKVRGLEMGAEDYLSKPIDAEELKARMRKILRSVRTPSREGATSVTTGRLESMGLGALIRLFEKDRRTACLALGHGAERGEILFMDGHILQAVQGPRQGEMAVFQMLGWTQGTFQVLPRDPARQMGGDVAAPNEALLLEGQRRAEEIPGLRKQLGLMPGPLRVPQAVRAAAERRSQPSVIALIGLLDGTRSLEQILGESPFDCWLSLKILAHLQSVGGVEIGNPEPERRGGLRLRVGIPIEYQGLGVWQQSASFNLSAWGVFIRTAVPFDAEAQVMVRFEMPGRDQPVAATGRVVWSNSDPSKWSGMGMGIEFLDLSTSDRTAIEEYLAQLVAERIGDVA